MGRPWGVIGGSWECLEGLFGALGASWGLIGAPRGLLVALLNPTTKMKRKMLDDPIMIAKTIEYQLFHKIINFDCKGMMRKVMVTAM